MRGPFPILTADDRDYHGTWDSGKKKEGGQRESKLINIQLEPDREPE